MSFGEKKRVSLATVLSMDPDILVLDEPAANMDPRGRREFIELLSCLKVTRLVVTHDLDMARQLCPRTIVMEKGRVVADGATSNLLSDRDFLYRSGLA
jgi:cobalt/nickel transport system ATP-binding protein